MVQGLAIAGEVKASSRPVSQFPLFATGHIQRVRSVTRGDLVHVVNSSEAYFAVCDRGRSWVLKEELEVGPQPIIAEAIGWLVGNEMGVRSPDAGYIRDDDSRVAWLSEYLNANHWGPSTPERLEDPAELGAILALDAVILNEDRHERNFLVLPVGGDETRLQLVQIDTGAAHVGWAQDFGDRIPSTEKLVRGIPVDACSDGAIAAAARIENVDEGLVRSWVRDAMLIVGDREDEISRRSEILLARCQGAVNLTTRYLQAIEDSQQ